MRDDTLIITINECQGTELSENKDEECSPPTPSGGPKLRMKNKKAQLTPSMHKNEVSTTKLKNNLNNTSENNKKDNDTNVSTKCEFTRKGVCKNHGTTSTKISVQSPTWKDRGGGKGFGFVTKHVTRYICTARKSLPIDLDISTNNLIADMDQDNLGFKSNDGISDKSLEHSRKSED